MAVNDKKSPKEGVDSLAQRIVAAREAQNLSVAQLARRIGAKSETLKAWETGRFMPRPNRLVILAGVLNVSPTWLLTGNGESPPTGAILPEMQQMRSTVERLRESTLAIAEELEELSERLDCFQSFQD